MKRQDLEKYHQQSIQELEAEIEKLEQELVELNLKKQMNQLNNLHEYKNLRHDIARLITIKTQKELAERAVSNQGEK